MHRIKLFITLGIGFLLARPATGQSFPPFSTVLHDLPKVLHGDVAWADIDADGDLDVAITGIEDPGGTYRTRIFRNDGDYFELDSRGVRISLTRFSVAATPSRQLAYGDVEWGDIEGDGDVDLLLSGADAAGVPFTIVLANDGTGGFTIHSTLVGLKSSSAAWGDFDLDGDLDIVNCGVLESGRHICYFYEYANGAYVHHDSGFTGVAFGDVVPADYDGDGDLDLLITGMASPQELVTRLYRNEGGFVFVDSGVPLEPLAFGSADWADYDLDGDPDILLSGGILSPFLLEGVLLVYTNENGTFNRINVGSRGAYYGTAKWGDIDNDGDPDIMLSGGTHPYLSTNTHPLGSRLGQFLINERNGRFETFAIPGVGTIFISAAQFGGADVGDYDNDGDLDLFVVGRQGSEGAASTEWRNELSHWGFGQNTAPSAPSGLQSSVEGASVTLSWTAASDAQTPAQGLTYNLRVGTQRGTGDVVPPLSVPLSGHRLVPKPGNTGGRTTWTLHNLPPGRYFWSVQAVDPGFKGSPFADEQEFTIGQ